MQLKAQSIKSKPEKPKIQNPSRVRDHLANERTYLAWMRTAIALMGFSVVIVRLRYLHPPMVPHLGVSWKLGLVFALTGLMTVLLTTQHYFAVRHDIDEDTYEPSGRWIILFSLSLLMLAGGVIYFVFSSSLDPNSLISTD
jgi:putative membrane protein